MMPVIGSDAAGTAHQGESTALFFIFAGTLSRVPGYPGTGYPGSQVQLDDHHDASDAAGTVPGYPGMHMHTRVAGAHQHSVLDAGASR
eukprot:2594761-Rhodomonas_salina.1